MWTILLLINGINVNKNHGLGEAILPFHWKLRGGFIAINYYWWSINMAHGVSWCEEIGWQSINGDDLMDGVSYRDVQQVRSTMVWWGCYQLARWSTNNINTPRESTSIPTSGININIHPNQPLFQASTISIHYLTHQSPINQPISITNHWSSIH